MKKLIFFLLLAPLFAHAQLPKSDRWTLLFEDPKTNQKTYIDNQTITEVKYYDGHMKGYLVWVRVYKDLTADSFSERMDEHLAVDLSVSQYELKSVAKYDKDGGSTFTHQYDIPNWIDIVPESNGELILNYLKKMGK
jgi:hypothetical protein